MTPLREQALVEARGLLELEPLVPEMRLAEPLEEVQAKRQPEPQQEQVLEAYLVLVAMERARVQVRVLG